MTDSTGNISDEYFYDAFGNDLASTGSTDNHYRFTGEQFDSGLNQYYLRARFYDQSSGRFTQMDEFLGRNSEPITLHKYLYANVDPVYMTDPSGRFSIASTMNAVGVLNTLVNTATTTIEVFQFATGEGEVTAKQIGAGLILGMLPGGSGLKALRHSNLKKKSHGNSKQSTKPQHVYQIEDTVGFDIYKYGISGVPLNQNGTSKRANTQANKLNKQHGFARFDPRVLFKNVQGRVAALAIELSLVCAYHASKGRNPIGNKRPICR